MILKNHTPRGGHESLELIFVKGFDLILALPSWWH
jgi:hypothetical protein